MSQLTLSTLKEKLNNFFEKEIKITDNIRHALTHPSAVPTKSDIQNEFQRLEWIGDSTINYMVSFHLFKKYPDASEEILSRHRTQIVRATGLAHYFDECELEQITKMGCKSPLTENVKCDFVEALIGALVDDEGIDSLKFLANKLIDRVFGSEPVSPKSVLGNWASSVFKAYMEVTVVSREGSSHDNDFVVRVDIKKGNNIALTSTGFGKSKSLATEDACRSLFPKKQSSPSTKSYIPFMWLKGILLSKHEGVPCWEFAELPGPLENPFICFSKFYDIEVSNLSYKEAEAEICYKIIAKYFPEDLSLAETEFKKPDNRIDDLSKQAINNKFNHLVQHKSIHFKLFNLEGPVHMRSMHMICFYKNMPITFCVSTSLKECIVDMKAKCIDLFSLRDCIVISDINLDDKIKFGQFVHGNEENRYPTREELNWTGLDSVLSAFTYYDNYLQSKSEEILSKYATLYLIDPTPIDNSEEFNRLSHLIGN